MVQTKTKSKSKSAKIAKKNKKIRRQKRKNEVRVPREPRRINPELPLASYVGRYGRTKNYIIPYDVWERLTSGWKEPVEEFIDRLHTKGLEDEYMMDDDEDFIYPAYPDHPDFLLNRKLLYELYNGKVDKSALPIKYRAKIVCKNCREMDYDNPKTIQCCLYGDCLSYNKKIDLDLFYLESHGYILPEESRKFYIENYDEFNPSS